MADSTPGLEQELFHACLDLPAAQRQAFLDRACPDDAALRGRIERLLAAHERAEQGTLNPVGGLAAEAMADRIGAYQIAGVLGEGGMGIVYEAEQLEPVSRRVALKVIKAGMDSEEVVRRFVAERQALAAMDHPYVAKVFDAGQTVSGRPYFVMELVRGEPLLEFCDGRALSVHDRVALVALVCQAVQHAHQKGVIHRDLKPSNVLVADDASGPIPRIIDFGIAKAIGADDAGRAAGVTAAGQAIGTPAYMSPEQAGRGPDVDTRADVYALGVMLYETLTGVLPVDPDELGHTEFLARLAKGELAPARPSARVGTPSADTIDIARRRSATPAGLRRQIQHDLDWIVMKAIDADRARRYATVAALAEDLERYRRGEAVAAGPPTVAYRVRKFIARYRVPVAAALVALVAILGGGVAAAAGFVRATRAEAAARQEADTAGQIAQFVIRLFEVNDPGEARGNAVTARELLDRGAAGIENDLGQQPSVQARLIGTLSRVYASLGLYRQSVELGERALALNGVDNEGGGFDEVLLAIGSSRQRLGDFEKARAALDRALAMRVADRGEDHLDVAQALNALGSLEWQLGRFDASKTLHERALAVAERAGAPDHQFVAESLRGLGRVANGTQKFEASLAYHRRALAIIERVHGTEHPLVADAYDDVGLSLESLKQLAESLTHLERALDLRRRVLGETHPTVAYSLHNIGRVLVAQGKLEAAVPLYEEGARIREQALGPDAPLTAHVVESLGIVQMRLGNLQEGLDLLARALSAYQRTYGPEHDETIESHRNMVVGLAMLKRYDEVIPHLREVVLRDVPAHLRLDLTDRFFDPMRALPAFRSVVAEVERRK
jgi:non-specific serine/threonine protein kinase/serine/threonine-protein kinase